MGPTVSCSPLAQQLDVNAFTFILHCFSIDCVVEELKQHLRVLSSRCTSSNNDFNQITKRDELFREAVHSLLFVFDRERSALCHAVLSSASFALSLELPYTLGTKGVILMFIVKHLRVLQISLGTLKKSNWPTSFTHLKLPEHGYIPEHSPVHAENGNSRARKRCTIDLRLHYALTQCEKKISTS